MIDKHKGHEENRSFLPRGKTCLNEDFVCYFFTKKNIKNCNELEKLLQNDMINDFNMTGFGF